MGYFVTESEIADKNKDIGSALAFALFLGIFGAHRFYLRRYVTGWIILLSIFITAWQSLWVVIPLVIIEFIQLAVISDRIKKQRASDVLSLLSTNNSEHTGPQHSSKTVTTSSSQPRQVISDFVSAPSHKTTRHYSETTSSLTTADTDDVAIYDVSDIETSQIDSVQAQSEPYTQGKWTKHLELPYERHDLRIPQIKQAVYQIYEELAEHIDHDLRKEKSSLEELGRRSMPSGYTYYDNVLYTIFCIAEGEVTTFYSGGLRSYDNSFSYQLLEQRLNKEYVKHVKQYAANLAKKLPPADEATKRHYGLTKNGLPVKWWDTDGVLRENYKLPDGLDQLLDVTPSRSTKLYEIPGIRAAIVLHYHNVLMVLEQQRTATTGWSQRMTKYLDRVFDAKWSYIEESYNIAILNYLLKLCEQAIRDNIPYTRPLDIKKERAHISRIIPKEAARAVFTAINDIKPLRLSEETIALLRDQNPTAWKSDLKTVESMSIEQVIAVLKTYSQKDTISKVAKEIAKKHEDPAAKLLAIYQTNVIEGSLDEWFEKKLSSIIHSAHTATYERLVTKNEVLSLAIAKQLIEMQTAPHKRVVLDDKKLALARKEHDRAVESVESYLGEDETEVAKPLVSEGPIITKEALFGITATETVTLTNDQKEFLELLVGANNELDLSIASDFTRKHKKMLNGYLQSLNKALYERFEDQVIMQRDGKIVIDNEYLKAVKELL